MSKKTIIILILLSLLGGILRFYNFTINPVSLNIDEVSIGYNAYSILKTGRDEYGEFLPLSFKSVGDYKPPILIYLTVPSIALFGLNEFGVRFPTAFISTLSIFLFYLFFRKIVKDEKYALLATILLTISPWHIYYSRYAVESLVATIFTVLGIYFLFKWLEEGRRWAGLASLLLVVSMYTYHSQRIFVPLIIIVFMVLNRRILINKKKQLFTFLTIFFILAVPLFYSMAFGAAKTRAAMTFITNDIEFNRYVSVDPQSIFANNTFLLFFYWARKFLNYFQPSFFFYNGLNMTMPGTYGLGVIYLFELTWLVLGICALIFKKIPNRFLILSWILVGIFPASLTINEQHSLRSLVILPPVLLLSAIGGITLFRILNNKLSKRFRLLMYIFGGIFVSWNLVYAFLIFAVHFPSQRGEAFMEGSKEVVQYALSHKDKYQEIVFDPVRGVDGPYIVSIPHMYVLFYSGYDPSLYQKIEKRSGEDMYGFDKFTIRRIDWREDRSKKTTLFIGSPWSLPEADLKSEEILKKIYLSNGKLAFLIVSPK